MLSGFRALDLTDEKGMLCGRTLADLGVEVVKVEKPGGDSARKLGPFYHDQPDPEKSLYWFAYNVNKKSVTLNLASAEGRSLFKRLAEKADFIIESFAPGELDRLGIGYEAISRINPRLVFTSITPFGQGGPRRDYQTCDLVSMALGGYLYLTGDPDRAPVRIGIPQSYVIAGAEAAAGTLIAHYYRQTTGLGQWVDVSVQHAVSLSLTHAIPFWELNHVILKRGGQMRTGLSQAGLRQRQVWRCKDGFVLYLITGGQVRARAQQALLAWIDEEGMADASIKGLDWSTVDMSTVSQEFIDRVEGCLAKFFLAHTKKELEEGGLKRRIDLYAVATTKNITESAQLEARGFWQTLEHPELGAAIKYPGPFVKASLTPLSLRTRAPLIGEHNREIYSAWLGMSDQEIAACAGAGLI